MILKSLDLDIQVLLVKQWRITKRILFIVRKYVSIGKYLIKKKSVFEFENIIYHYSSLSEIGTLCSCVVDVYNEISSADVIDRAHPVIVDVGANTGQFLNAIKLFYPESVVYCFEPNDEIYAKLSLNSEHFSDVTLFQVGLGDSNDKKVFYRNELHVMSSFVVPEDNDHSYTPAGLLDIKPLDDCLPDDLVIDLLKVDVEGFELSVINGAIKTLSSVKYLLIELGFTRSGDNNLSVLHRIKDLEKGSAITKIGRPLGDGHNVLCQDFLIKINSDT